MIIPCCQQVSGQDSTAANSLSFYDTVISRGSYIAGSVQFQHAPLAGMTVRVKGKKKSTATDPNGYFRIDADSNEVLVFSILGMASLETKANDHYLEANDLAIRINTVVGKSPTISIVTRTLPVFPIPYPPPSATYVVALPARWKINSFGKADSILKLALNYCGYQERRYYPIKQGFALVTQMEQTNGEGFSLHGSSRWSYTIAHELNSPWDYLKALFLAPEGKFRVIVFLLSNGDPLADPARGAINAEMAKGWLEGGGLVLNKELRAMTGPQNIYMLVYQYEKAPGTTPVFVHPGTITGEQHFIRSKIADKLK